MENITLCIKFLKLHIPQTPIEIQHRAMIKLTASLWLIESFYNSHYFDIK